MILITGSSGFIGSNFVNFFLKNKIKFHGIDKKKSKYIKFNDFSKINLTNKEKLKKLFKKIKPNIIIHLAADSGLNYCHNNKENAFDNNLISTFNLLTMCNKFNCKKFFFASSMSVENFDKSFSFYGFTKFASENLIKSFKKNYNITGIIARFSNIFGPFSSHKTSAIHEIIKCKLSNKKGNIMKDKFSNTSRSLLIKLHTLGANDGVISKHLAKEGHSKSRASIYNQRIGDIEKPYSIETNLILIRFLSKYQDIQDHINKITSED